MKIIKLTKIEWDSFKRIVHTEEIYINTMHIHLFKSAIPVEQMVNQGYDKITNITVGDHGHFYVAETPQEIQKTINYLHQ